MTIKKVCNGTNIVTTNHRTLETRNRMVLFPLSDHGLIHTALMRYFMHNFEMCLSLYEGS